MSTSHSVRGLYRFTRFWFLLLERKLPYNQFMDISLQIILC